MNRVNTSPRPDWQKRVEAIGLSYHTPNGVPYWNESAYYRFSPGEIEMIETATKELHRLCIAAAGEVIRNGRFADLGIPLKAVGSIVRSWERDEFSLYGRFDLAYDGSGPPKMLEYNADTPTSLVEAAVAQWHWLQDVFPAKDQFNSIHERLIEAWKRLAAAEDAPSQRIHFGGVKDHPEDGQTVLYLQDTCHQAGFETRSLPVGELGWNPDLGRFVDLDDAVVSHYFKLYPWEWMWAESFSDHLQRDVCRFVEPCWKMLLSNKGLLPVLWEMFPGHPNLLPAYFDPSPLNGSFVQKPKLSREGANVSVVRRGAMVSQTGGDYGEEGFVFQEIALIPELDGFHPVLGSWVVDHEPAGMGIREDVSLITGNLSRFVPHWID